MTSTDTVERHKDTERNLILNKTLSDLDSIINGHDPEVDTSINNLVWDRLDKMAVDIEARAAMPSPDVGEAARVLLSLFETPDEGPEMPIEPQYLYDLMTADHEESLEVTGYHDWPALLATALRALSTPTKGDT